jgi:hypothetical protein
METFTPESTGTEAELGYQTEATELATHEGTEMGELLGQAAIQTVCETALPRLSRHGNKHMRVSYGDACTD